MREEFMIPILITIILLYGIKSIMRDKRGNDYRITLKNIFWKNLLFWALKQYDSSRGVYLDGDISFDFDITEWLNIKDKYKK